MHIFKDGALYERAFKRRDYDVEDNYEVLEFVGDQVIGMAVTRDMLDYGISDDEGELTQIRQALVCKEYLGERLEDLCLEKKIKYGKNDELNGVDRRKVEADVLEAIIGAIAIDSHWDWKEISAQVREMLGIHFEDGKWAGEMRVFASLGGNSFLLKEENGGYVAESGNGLLGHGKTRLEARFDCAMETLHAAPKKSRLELCGFTPSITDAINQINILQDKGLLRKKPDIEEAYRVGKMWHSGTMKAPGKKMAEKLNCFSWLLDFFAADGTDVSLYRGMLDRSQNRWIEKKEFEDKAKEGDEVASCGYFEFDLSAIEREVKKEKRTETKPQKIGARKGASICVEFTPCVFLLIEGDEGDEWMLLKDGEVADYMVDEKRYEAYVEYWNGKLEPRK